MNTPRSSKAKWIERNVIDYYASLWNTKWPYDSTDPETYWGYVLTMGSTEGNLHAMWSARNYLSGKYVQVKWKTTIGDTNDTAQMVYQLVQGKFSPPNTNSSVPVVCSTPKIAITA